MTRDPEKRLGANGADEIKAHVFFADIQFERLAKKSVAAPFKPTVNSELDTSQFDEQFLRELPMDSLVDTAPLPDSVQEKFRGFTFHGDEEGQGVTTQARSIRLSPNFQPDDHSPSNN